MERPPWVCTTRAEGRLFPASSAVTPGYFCFSKVFAFPSPGQDRMLACPSEGRGDTTARTKESQVTFTHLKIPKQFKMPQTPSALKLLRHSWDEVLVLTQHRLGMVSIPAFPKSTEKPLPSLSILSPSSSSSAASVLPPRLFCFLFVLPSSDCKVFGGRNRL